MKHTHPLLPDPWRLIGYIPQDHVHLIHAQLCQTFPEHFIAFAPEAHAGKAAVFTCAGLVTPPNEQWTESCHADLWHHESLSAELDRLMDEACHRMEPAA